MKPTPVDRYMFTVEEVIAAILPNVGRARELELRVDADGYVVVDVVQPAGIAAQNAGATADPPHDAEPQQSVAPARRTDAPASSSGAAGQREDEARSLCRQQLFRAFLGVKTEEAAIKILAERCHVRELAELDCGRSNGMNLRHVVEDFEGWKIT